MRMSITNPEVNTTRKVQTSPSTKRRQQNWHPADIIAALHKKGTTLAALSRDSGLCSSTLANALSRPWPKGELLIARALNVKPQDIWPSRFIDEHGKPLERKIRAANKR